LSTETEQEILDRLNSLTPAEAQAEFMRCCGTKRWARGMTARRPFHSKSTLLGGAESLWALLTAADWREAFAHHPKIGDIGSLRRKFASTSEWTSGEQSGVVGADEEVLKSLAEGNAAYEAKFGYIFIVCATGKSAGEMLEILQARLPNGPRTELKIASGEQKKITRLRLEKLFTETTKAEENAS
jgi:2-oxo-4-hydroxy-4-carboxy-5-ureidoimidazoline decarboxylase